MIPSPLDLDLPKKGMLECGNAIYKFLKAAQQINKQYMHVIRHSSQPADLFLSPNKETTTYFPSEIQKHINETLVTQTLWEFKCREKTVRIYCYEKKEKTQCKEILKYLPLLRLWFSLMNIITEKFSKPVNKTLDIFLYMTSFKKEMPPKDQPFSHKHINSAYTYVCLKHGTITIFREEEWFKVLLHECFHSYCLDFTPFNDSELRHCLLKYFPLKIDGLALSETYTETWAEILNVAMIAFFHPNLVTSANSFSRRFHSYMEIEVFHSILQSKKILHRYGISFQEMREKNTEWSQETHLFEYHILKTLLLVSYGNFFTWCKLNNGLLLFPFRNNKGSMSGFCKLLKESYQDPLFKKLVTSVGRQHQHQNRSLRMSVIQI